MRAAAAVSSANEACTRHKTPAFFSLPSFPELQCHVDFLSPIKQSISLSNNAVQGSPLSAARRRQVGACRVSPLVGRRREGELVSAVGIEPLKKGKNSAGKKKKKKKSPRPLFSNPLNPPSTPAPLTLARPLLPLQNSEQKLQANPHVLPPPKKPRLRLAPPSLSSSPPPPPLLPPPRAAASPSARPCSRASRTEPRNPRSARDLTASCSTTTTRTRGSTWSRCCSR